MFKKWIIGNSILFMLFCSNVQAEETVASPESWSFPQVIESARKISPTNVEGRPFNQFGLVYSPEELSKLDFSKMKAEKMQNYADIVTHAYPDAIAKQLPNSCEAIPIGQLNETSIAGIAYISIHASKAETRNKAKMCLSTIQRKLKEQ